MRITLIHPAMGHRPGVKFLRTWQMEPLPLAAVARLTPKDVEVRFYDDRMERVPFDEPTDLVGLSVETFTARRAYQIATEYRRRGVPVVMGGFHATLLPGEVERYAEAVVVGEAEGVWPEVVEDARAGRLKKRYRRTGLEPVVPAVPDRSIFRGKRYLPIGLLELGRGCRHPCEFCAIQTVFERRRTVRPVDEVVAELEAIRERHRLFFFVDDNIGADLAAARELARAIRPLGVRWVSQCSIEACHDESLLAEFSASGCQGLLVGLETLNPVALKAMSKSFNAMGGGFERALANLRRQRLALYGTFVFGYDQDDPGTFAQTVAFARREAFYLAAFAPLMPLPGTPLYGRLEREGRLLSPHWWLDEGFSFNETMFRPASLSPAELREQILIARRSFYSWPSMLERGAALAGRVSGFLWRAFWPMNVAHRREIPQRDGHPLGDPTWQGELREAA